MAGKKKKKPAANPARGFATVSIPSKPKDVITNDDSSIDHDQENSSHISIQPENENALTPSQHTVPAREATIEEMSPEELEAHLEESELQLIVEQHAARVKNDASRQASRLQSERRQLRAQADPASIMEWSDQLINQICTDLPLQSSRKNMNPASARSLGGDETQTLLNLWTLHEVLVELKMPSVQDALAHVLSGWLETQAIVTAESITGLSEALEWYAGNKKSDDLPTYDTGEIATIGASQAFDDEANGLNGLHTAIEHISDEPEETSELSDGHVIPPELDFRDDNGDEDDPDTLVETWVQLQTLNFGLERYKNANDYVLRKRRIDQKLHAIERDMLFDIYLARQKWQQIRIDLEIELAQADREKERGARTAGNVEVTNVAGDNHEQDAMLGDMFNDDESTPTGAASELQVSMMIKDFGLWAGLHPRRLFEEICSGSFSRLKYHPLQVTSFSAKLKLEVFWISRTTALEPAASCLPSGVHFDQRPKSWTFEMRSLATPNSAQAEALLATLAIFLVTATGLAGTRQLVRLPKVWRDLCADLKRGLDDIQVKVDVQKLKSLRGLIRARVGTDACLKTKSIEHDKSLVMDSETTARNKKGFIRLSATEVTEIWLCRARSAAFENMQAARKDLPVFAYKQEILDSFEENGMLLICADTGAGKSTQIPSYILEHELSHGRDLHILVTQPRRISAVSIARRVSAELGEGKDDLGTSRSLVGYAIRLESKTSPSTRITFATTGVLLRILQDSPNLDQLDCLILDEIHERTMDLDLLFIALKKMRAKRTNLKIILMSATVNASKFSTYFDNCPVLDIPGRMFPVEVNFLENAIEETLDIKSSVGSIEDEEDRLQASDDDEVKPPSQDQSNLEGYSSLTRKLISQYDNTRTDYQLILKLAIAVATKPKYHKYSKAILIFMPGIAEIRRLHSTIMSSRTFSSKWVLHMLHSSFSTQELEQAFLPPPPGFRKIVIATNIAETGITIPDVTAVIDSCKEKIMRFDERRQLSRLTEGLISRASARQRRGRAARVQNGLCFHLVTQHHHDTKMPEQSTPEMLRLSLQDPILRIKIWDLGPIEEILSAAIDPPGAKNVRRAISKLRDIGAIDLKEQLTPLGKLVAKLPLDVALSKMAIYGIIFQSLDAILTIIATLSVKSIFVEVPDTKISPQASFSRGDSDLLTVYNAYSGWKKACRAGTGQQFCYKYHLSQFQLLQVEEQKVQLLVYLTDAGLIVLDKGEHGALSRARSSRKRIPEFDIPGRYDRLNSDTVTAAIIAVAFHPKLLRRESGQGFRNVYTNQQLQLATTSINRITGGKLPRWFCYLEAVQAKNGRLNAFNSSRVTEAMILILLGNADFKIFAGVVIIDHGSVRLTLRHWKEVLAIQCLRQQILKVVDRFLANPEIPLRSSDVQWLDLMEIVLGGEPQSRNEVSLAI